MAKKLGRKEENENIEVENVEVENVEVDVETEENNPSADETVKEDTQEDVQDSTQQEDNQEHDIEVEVSIEKEEDDQENEVKVEVDQEAVKDKTLKPKDVRVRVKRDHKCFIGGQLYDLKAGVCYNVPEFVKSVLLSADILSPL